MGHKLNSIFFIERNKKEQEIDCKKGTCTTCKINPESCKIWVEGIFSDIKMLDFNQNQI